MKIWFGYVGNNEIVIARGREAAIVDDCCLRQQSFASRWYPRRKFETRSAALEVAERLVVLHSDLFDSSDIKVCWVNLPSTERH